MYSQRTHVSKHEETDGIIIIITLFMNILI